MRGENTAAAVARRKNRRREKVIGGLFYIAPPSRRARHHFTPFGGLVPDESVKGHTTPRRFPRARRSASRAGSPRQIINAAAWRRWTLASRRDTSGMVEHASAGDVLHLHGSSALSP